MEANQDLWNSLEYLKTIRNKIAHTGEVYYEQREPKYYTDRKLAPKKTLKPLPKGKAKELVEKAKAILDWLGEEQADIASSPSGRQVPSLPDYPEDLVTLGVQHAKDGNLDVAIEKLREAVNIRDDYPKAWYNLGIALGDRADHDKGDRVSAQRDLDDAIAAFEKAAQEAPDYRAAFGNLGVVAGKRGNFGKALAAFQEVVRLKPDDSEAHHNIGLTLTRTGDLYGAIAAFGAAVTHDPKHARAHHNLAIALSKSGAIGSANRSAGQDED